MSQEDALRTWAVPFQSRSNLMGKVGPGSSWGSFWRGQNEQQQVEEGRGCQIPSRRPWQGVACLDSQWVETALK